MFFAICLVKFFKVWFWLNSERNIILNWNWDWYSVTCLVMRTWLPLYLPFTVDWYLTLPKTCRRFTLQWIRRLMMWSWLLLMWIQQHSQSNFRAQIFQIQCLEIIELLPNNSEKRNPIASYHITERDAIWWGFVANGLVNLAIIITPGKWLCGPLIEYYDGIRHRYQIMLILLSFLQSLSSCAKFMKNFELDFWNLAPSLIKS